MLAKVRRHRDRSLFGGSAFVKLTGRVANATAAQALGKFQLGSSFWTRLGCFRPWKLAWHCWNEVAHCHMHFADRAGWDKQMDGFKILHPC